MSSVKRFVFLKLSICWLDFVRGRSPARTSWASSRHD